MMRKLALALVLLLAPSLAWGQCTGVFANNQVCGNATGAAATPRATNSVSFPANLTVGVSTITGGANHNVLYDNAGLLGEVTSVNGAVLYTSIAGVPQFGQNPRVGGAGIGTGSYQIAGTTSGFASLTVPAVAGTPVVTFGSGTGTPAVTATSPLVIAAATGDITCTTCLTTSSFSNPSASVGLTAVNGVATTAMRSDGAPPLSSGVQSALTGTNNGVLLGTGAFGFSAITPVANSLLSYNNSSVPSLTNIITGQNYLAAMTNAGEAYGYSFRNSTTTGTAIYTPINGGVVPNIQDGIQSVLVVPSTATVGASLGIGVYFQNNAVAAVNTVGISSIGMGTTTNSPIWGINTLLTDNATRATHARTGQIMIGAELDFNVMGASTQVIGASIGGNSLAQSTSALGFVCNSLNGAAVGIVYKWDHCFITQDGVGTNAFVSGVAKNDSTPNTPSQASWFLYYDSTGTRKIASTFVDETGYAFLNSNSGALTTLVVGSNTTNKGTIKLFGNTSGAAIITPQTVAGTPTLTLPNASGTFAVSVSVPLALSATTGNLTITGAAGQVLAGATPAFTATPTLGVAGATLGTISLAGNTSGTVLITPQAAAGGTPVTFTLPNASGTPVINVPSPLTTSATSGAMTWTGLTSGGVLYASSTTAVGSSALLATGKIMIGGGAGAAPTTTGWSVSATDDLTVTQASAFSPILTVTNTTNDANGALWRFNKNRASGPATAGDVMFWIQPGAFDSGSVNREAANFKAEVDAVAAGSVSGRWVWTTSNAGTIAERARLTSTGGWNVGAYSADPGSGVINAVSGYKANGTSGVSTTCTVTVANTYVFTFGLLTTKGANCT